jgi:hypothetical protein
MNRIIKLLLALALITSVLPSASQAYPGNVQAILDYLREGGGSPTQATLDQAKAGPNGFLFTTILHISEDENGSLLVETTTELTVVQNWAAD